MHKFIKTFFLWLGLFTFCNVISLFAVKAHGTCSVGHLFLHPLAWILQFPLVAVFALFHHGANHAFLFLPLKWKKPLRFVLCALCIFFFMGMYTASQIMFQQINTFISWDAYLAAFSNWGQVLPDILGEMGGELFLIAALAVGVSLIYTRRYHNSSSSPSPLLFVVLCSVFFTSAAGGFVMVYKNEGEWSDRIRQCVLPTTYLTFSIIDDLLPSVSPTADFLADMILAEQVPMAEYFQFADLPVERPDVYLIMLESISWDHYGFTGYGRSDVTPHLDALAAESVVFPTAYAAANHSSYAQTSVHASQYPLRRKTLHKFETVNYPKTMLFDILSYAGYKTAFFSAQNEDWQGMRSFVFANTKMQHFFHSKDVLGEHIGIEAKIDDETVLQHAIEYLENGLPDEPVFMYLNFQATHFPYAIPPDAAHPYEPCSTDGFDFNYTEYDRDHLEQVMNKYDNALHYVDRQVGALVEFLKAAGRYERSLIVVASDHGEAFYKHGLPTHSTSLYDDQMRTALLFKLPGQTGHTLRNDPVSLIDINPTILEALGLPNHPGFQGRQVLETPRTEPVYMVSHSLVKSHGVVAYPWKYFISERDGERLLNLNLDPQELEDYSAAQPELLNELRQTLRMYQLRQLYYYTVLPQAERDRLYPPQH